jgi:hypothetical protein
MGMAAVAPVVPSAWAQVATSEAASSVSPAAAEVVSTPDHQSQIAQLQTSYAKYLSAYRDNERLFLIAQQQFFQLGTLASLEQAVQATKGVMLSRMDVLQSYLSFLELHLIDSKGIEVGLKNANVAELMNLLSQLKIQHAQVQAADDRLKIAKAAADFQILAPQLQQQAELTKSLIMYGRLQAVYDKTLAVKGEIAEQIKVKETNPLVLAEKQRGIQEVERNLDTVKAQLDKVRSQLSNKDSGSFGFQAANSDLDAIYGGLSRSLSYFEELVR